MGVKPISRTKESRSGQQQQQQHGQDVTVVMDNNVDKMELFPCPICSRTFSKSSLKRHVTVCEKIQANPKRKIFKISFTDQNVTVSVADLGTSTSTSTDRSQFTPSL